jgi:hypothetical protein
MGQVRCSGCGALVPDVSGPTHRYVPSAPGCWKVFGEVQADEMQRFGYPPAHRLVVDAYMAQHPGVGVDRRDRQSVFTHLVALCAVLERSVPPNSATQMLGQVVRSRADFPVLARAHDSGALTVLHMRGAEDLDDYSARAREWADAVWQSWAEQHEMIRAALAETAAVDGLR